METKLNLKAIAAGLFCLSLICLLQACVIKDPVEEPTTVTDIDGNVYQIVKIGNQIWMASNLKVTKFRNGDAIPTTSPANQDLTGNSSLVYQWPYNGAESNVAVYGRLYSWAAVNDSRKLAPAGWHIPTDAEWDELINYLGGDQVAGGKIKETGTGHWVSPNDGATNSCGFNAVPSGNRNLNGSFYDLGYHACWWTATGNGSGFGNYRVVHKDGAKTFSFFYGDQKVGMAVRCVKD